MTLGWAAESKLDLLEGEPWALLSSLGGRGGISVLLGESKGLSFCGREGLLLGVGAFGESSFGGKGGKLGFIGESSFGGKGGKLGFKGESALGGRGGIVEGGLIFRW